MDQLQSYLAQRLRQKPPADFAALAEIILKTHSNVALIFAYGSGIRGETVNDTLLDLYVLTDDASGISTNPLSAMASEIVPPNVYYLATGDIRAKYAAVSFAVFERWLKPQSRNPYFWARFSQPTMIVWARREADQNRFIASIAQSTVTAFSVAKSFSNDPIESWAQLFAKTYATEFRPERLGRARDIVMAHEEYFRNISVLLKDLPPKKLSWPRLRFEGKLWSALRLFKAAFTFQGGADYAAWKISKHSGEKIIVTDWQRRHPLLAGLLLLPKLLARGLLK